MHRLYRRLVELGDAVTVACVVTADETESIETMRKEGMAVRAHVRPRSRLRELLAAIIRRPSILRGLAFRSSKELISSVFWVDLAATVRDELASGDHDVVVIESSFAAFWRGQIETDLPVVLVTHEVESIQLMDKGARIGGIGGLGRYINGARVRRSEQRWTPRFDGVVVMSEEEQHQLEGIVGSATMPRSYVVGNGADLDVMDAVGPDPDDQTVLFTGTMAYPPNAVGAQWLAREVWPLVLAESPDAQLAIVGASPSRATRALDALPGVSVHADVPDMRPWFSGASVCTLPMLEGGGTRLKLIDAFAARRAVVSTTNGATGIDCQAGHDLLIADTPEDFARDIVRLLADAELRARLARNGRALAERLYDWDSLGEKLHDALEGAIAARTATPIKVVVSDLHA